ncbi:ferric reductase-like transmembrane domain-containing protein [Qipengyuania sp.]|uniref:ferric reductase-like transmembrane domain-containing protein n=1 Tax=Qipengyuania sp. TaxID=2004515 RepID=UPI0035C83955
MSWRRALIWLLLGIPAVVMVQRYLSGDALAMELYHPSGEMSVRLMILALLPGPLIDTFGPSRFLRGWMSLRRNLGVAAFAYALLHLVLYTLDMRTLSAMIAEFALPGIWTGWLAFALLLVPASISFDAAMRGLGARWKRMQRLVYPAFILALAHWLLLDWDPIPALVHLTPLALAWALRFVVKRKKSTSRSMA